MARSLRFLFCRKPLYQPCRKGQAIFVPLPILPGVAGVPFHHQKAGKQTSCFYPHPCQKAVPWRLTTRGKAIMSSVTTKAASTLPLLGISLMVEHRGSAQICDFFCKKFHQIAPDFAYL
jgi:hypothetical protein